MWKNGEHDLDLKSEEEVKRFKNFLIETYNNSEKKNVNLHITTRDNCYSSEINETHNEGSIEEQVNAEIEFMTNPEEPTHHVMVGTWKDNGDEDVDCEFILIKEPSPQFDRILKLME